MTGLEWAQRWLDGTVPIPVADLLGARVVEVAEGQCSMALTTSEWLCMERNRVSSAPLTALASMTLYAATWTLAARAQRMAPVHQVVDFIRGVRPDGRDILARAKVTEWNEDFALASTVLTDAAGNVVARAHQTAMPVGLRNSRGDSTSRRVLTTVLFSDIAGSTQLVETLGDARWQELLEEHHVLVRRNLALFGGREVKTTGDGFLATFDSPAQAVRCACAIREGLQRHSVQVRIGVHTGECDVVGGDLSGIAVHIASRVQSAAGPGEILVSATVRDLVAGSGLRFSDRGQHALKGIEGEWQLLAVDE
jgi:class 3 adenylate cyclase